MPSRLIELPWTEQPQEAAGAAEGLTALVLPSVRADVVSGRPTVLLGSAGYAVGRGGVEVRTTGPSADFVRVVADSSSLLSTTEATIIFHGHARTAGANGEFGVSDVSNPTRCGAHVPFTDGTVYWDFGGASAGTTRLTAPGLTFSALDVWAFTTGPRGMEIWQNGVLRASNSATPTRSASTAPFGLGQHAQSAPASSDLVTAFAFGYAPKQLGAGLLRHATSSPAALWSALVEPRRLLVPVSAAAPTGIPTLSAATVTSITATTARPRVTITF